MLHVTQCLHPQSMDQQFWTCIHITQHADGHSRPVYEFIFYECFAGGASVTGYKRGTSKQQLGEERSSEGKRGVAFTFPTIIHTFMLEAQSSSYTL